MEYWDVPTAEEEKIVLFGPLSQGLLLDKFDPDRPPQFGKGDIRAGNKGFKKDQLLGVRR